MTTVGELAQLAQARLVGGEDAATLEVADIGLDTTTLEPGALFAAVPGTRAHGARFAAGCSASAFLTDEAGAAIIAESGDPRPVLVVDDVRAVLGRVSAAIYGDPSAKLTLIGITGTSGKTTTSYLLEQGLLHAGVPTALIGTTGTRIKGRPVPTSLTTPEAPTLQALFARMLDEGVTHVVMEVSSHALELGRVAGARFDVAGFTNFSQDHLDFHQTMADYFEAKARFFDPDSPLAAPRSVVCVDDEGGAAMARRAGAGALTVGTRGQREVDVRGEQLSHDATGGQRIAVSFGDRRIECHLPLPGDFNVANATLALALAHAIGADVDAVAAGIEHVAVPGRMERIDEGQDFLAVVDYAHKPAAVAAVLATLRRQVPGRIGVVIGCGGDRDALKRPLMGAEAARGAELVVVTDDNPRSEDPAAIRAAVVAGAREAAADADTEILEFGSRRQAIEVAIDWARPGDAVAVVGKGHEVGQLVGDEVLHFDDREEVRRAIAARQERRS